MSITCSRSLSLGGASAALLLLAPAVRAQSAADWPALMVSTTGDAGVVTPGLPALTDGDLLRVGPGVAPRPWLVDGNWRALTGLVPTDVDALAWRPDRSPLAAEALAFSLLGDQQGFLDGDVLGLAGDGSLTILFAEEQLAFALGLPDAALDVDALAFDGSGALLFSLQSDLDGTSLGAVANGDVLRLTPSGAVERLATEADVEAALTVATSLTAAVGDVHGLEWVNGELWVAVQSPGDLDGGVLALGLDARIVVEETDLGLGGEELDALAVLPEFAADPLALRIDPSSGASVGVVEGATPGGVGIALATALGGHAPAPGLGGIGAFGVDVTDPLLALQLQVGPTLFVVDGSGRFEAPLSLPVVGAGLAPDGSLGWTFQVVDLAAAELSPPFRVDV